MVNTVLKIQRERLLRKNKYKITEYKLGNIFKMFHRYCAKSKAD